MNLFPKRRVKYVNYHDEPVLGLIDVLRGARPMYLKTVYSQKDNDRSGMIGLLWPDGTFVPKPSSTTGQVVTGVDDDKVPFTGVIVWDGAKRGSFHEKPADWRITKSKVLRESSKGILLGDYPNTGELWNALKAGRSMV